MGSQEFQFYGDLALDRRVSDHLHSVNEGAYTMSKNILMAMFLALIAVAPAGAAVSKGASQAEMVAANDSSNEAVDCFYEQNRYLPECKKK